MVIAAAGSPSARADGRVRHERVHTDPVDVRVAGEAMLGSRLIAALVIRVFVFMGLWRDRSPNPTPPTRKGLRDDI